MKMIIPLIGLLIVFFSSASNASTIKGVVLHKNSKAPIAFATVVMLDKSTLDLIEGYILDKT